MHPLCLYAIFQPNLSEDAVLIGRTKRGCALMMVHRCQQFFRFRTKLCSNGTDHACVSWLRSEVPFLHSHKYFSHPFHDMTLDCKKRSSVSLNRFGASRYGR